MPEDDDPIVGYTEIQPGVLTLQRLHGPELTIRDEDGSKKAQVEAIVQKNNSGTERPGGMPMVQAPAPASPIVPPVAAPAPISPVEALAGGIEAPAIPPAPPAPVAPVTAPAPVAPPPQYEQPQSAPPPGLLPAGHTIKQLAPQSAQAMNMAGQQVDAAQGVANQSAFATNQARAQAEAQAFSTQQAQAREEELVAQNRKDIYSKSLADNLAKQDEIRKRPIDTTAAFGGARGWMSALAALAVDRSNMFAALAGVPMQKNSVIDDVIARTVRQQEAQKKLDLGAAGELVGADRAEIQQLELNMREAVRRQREAEIGKIKAGPMQEAAQAQLDQENAKTKQLGEQRAKDLATHTMTQFAPPAPVKPGPEGNKYQESEGANRIKLEGLKQWSEQAGVPVKEAHKKYEQVGGFYRAQAGVLESERVILDLIKGADKSGDVAGLGYLDGMAPNWAVSELGMAIRQNFGDMLDSYGRSKTGAAMPESETALFRNIAQGSASPSEVRRGIEIMTRAAHAENKELRKQFPGLTGIYDGVDGHGRTVKADELRRTAIRRPAPKVDSKPQQTTAQVSLAAEKKAREEEQAARVEEQMAKSRDRYRQTGRRSGGGRF